MTRRAELEDKKVFKQKIFSRRDKAWGHMQGKLKYEKKTAFNQNNFSRAKREY